jgi:hypothetical protein
MGFASVFSTGFPVAGCAVEGIVAGDFVGMARAAFALVLALALVLRAEAVGAVFAFVVAVVEAEDFAAFLLAADLPVVVAAGFLCAPGAMYPCGTFFTRTRWVAAALNEIRSSEKRNSLACDLAHDTAALINAMAPSKRIFGGEAPERVREVCLFILEKSRSSNSIEETPARGR